MKISCLFICFLFFALLVHAQNPIPNSSFELWNGFDPIGWENSNAMQTGLAHTGNSAAVMQYTGNLSVGNGSGLSITTRWNYLNFYYRFSGPAITNAIAKVYILNGTDTIGQGFVDLPITSGNDFKAHSLAINYSQSGNPTSCYIHFTQDDISIGSEFSIDDVSFSDTQITGMGSLPPDPDFSFVLAPNPTTDFMEIKMAEETLRKNSSLGIYNLSGSLIWDQPLSQTQKRISTGWLPDGIYLLKISSEGEHLIRKFVKAK